ncbi:Uncharacterised protein [Mycobacteroides abscessus subsp. abscessus]|nr:Uncharacterised protein [Mycobacteroides abscessus subsp. abscessus]
MLYPSVGGNGRGRGPLEYAGGIGPEGPPGPVWGRADHSWVGVARGMAIVGSLIAAAAAAANSFADW